jgi:hypothetical protein
VVKPRRRKLGRLGDNLTEAEVPAEASRAEREAVAQDRTIDVPPEVAQQRRLRNVSNETLRARRRRLGLPDAND